MKSRSATAFAPASLSNLGPGFDVLGLAIEKPGDVVVAKTISERELIFHLRSKEEGIPLDAKKNVASHVVRIMLEEFKWPFGVDLTLHKKMPLGSGLGSSAASSVAAAVAVNALLRKPLKKNDLLRFVAEGERLASGSLHADNAAPCLLGGACLVRSYTPLEVIQIPVKNNFWWVVVHPHLVVLTKTARKILPRNVPLRSAARQWGNVAGLIVGLMAGDVQLFGRSMEDIIIEPARAGLIPGFYEAKEAAYAAGAYGCTLTGSGPAMFAVAQTRSKAALIGKAIANSFRRNANVRSEIYLSKINMDGANVVRRIA